MTLGQISYFSLPVIHLQVNICCIARIPGGIILSFHKPCKFNGCLRDGNLKSSDICHIETIVLLRTDLS